MTGANADGDHGVLEHLLLADHPRAVRIALVLLAISLGLFVAMAIPVGRDAIDAMDRHIYDLTFPVKWGPLTALAHGLDFLGSAYFVWPVRALGAAHFTAKRRWRALTVWLGAAALSEPFIGTLKEAYDRARPPQALVAEVTGSFPSGHSVAGSVMALALVICFVGAGPKRRNLEIAAAAFALLMGGSRIYLGAHWFTDVAAGVAFGAACTLAVAAAAQWYVAQRAMRHAVDDDPAV